MTTDPGDRFAAGRSFPTALPAPGTGGGAELGELVQLYRPAGSWPAPADAPAAAPPIVASGPGSRVGWLLRSRRGTVNEPRPSLPSLIPPLFLTVLDLDEEVAQQDLPLG